MCSRDPVQRALDLAFSQWTATARPWVIGAMNLRDFTGVVLFKALASDDICSLKSYLLPRCQTEELLRRSLHEVFLFYINLPAEGYHAGSLAFVFGVIEYLHLFLSLIHISEPTRLGMISYAV